MDTVTYKVTPAALQGGPVKRLLPSLAHMFRTKVYQRGADIVIPIGGVLPMQSGPESRYCERMASGLSTGVAEAQYACCLPLPTDRWSRGTPLPPLPWNQRVVIQRGNQTLTALLLDEGPVHVDPEPSIIRVSWHLWRQIIHQPSGHFPLWPSPVLASIVLPGAAAFLSDYVPWGTVEEDDAAPQLALH